MIVNLLSFTHKPAIISAMAANTCYSGGTTEEIEDKFYGTGGRAEAGDLLKKVVSSGHTSVLEHVTFTFMISGISRACSHQLVRHRIATYSQQSQRYVDGKNFAWVTPPSVKAAGEDAERIYNNAMQAQQTFYQELTKLGVPKEDARFVLTNATTTRIVATFNARELIHIFNLRTCNRAQWEIRDLARAMLAECRAIFPEIFNLIGPSCYTTGKCPEGSRSCGKAEIMKTVFTPQPNMLKKKEIYELNKSEMDKLLEDHAACDPMQGESGELIANAIKVAKANAFRDKILEAVKKAGLSEEFIEIPEGKYPDEELMFMPEVKFYIASMLNGDLYASELILIHLKGEMIRTGLLRGVADHLMGYLRDVYHYNHKIAEYTSNKEEKIKQIADECCDLVYSIWNILSSRHIADFASVDNYKNEIVQRIELLTPKEKVIAPYAEILINKIEQLVYHEEK